MQVLNPTWSASNRFFFAILFFWFVYLLYVCILYLGDGTLHRVVDLEMCLKFCVYVSSFVSQVFVFQILCLGDLWSS